MFAYISLISPLKKTIQVARKKIELPVLALNGNRQDGAALKTYTLLLKAEVCNSEKTY